LKEASYGQKQIVTVVSVLVGGYRGGKYLSDDLPAYRVSGNNTFGFRYRAIPAQHSLHSSWVYLCCGILSVRLVKRQVLGKVAADAFTIFYIGGRSLVCADPIIRKLDRDIRYMGIFLGVYLLVCTYEDGKAVIHQSGRRAVLWNP
jgi:hypothetical protein